MKSKNETNNPTKEPESLSRRSAIITAGAGVVAAVGATSQTSAAESATNKNALNMDGATVTSKTSSLNFLIETDIS